MKTIKVSEKLWKKLMLLKIEQKVKTVEDIIWQSIKKEDKIK